MSSEQTVSSPRPKSPVEEPKVIYTYSLDFPVEEPMCKGLDCRLCGGALLSKPRPGEVYIKLDSRE